MAPNGIQVPEWWSVKRTIEQPSMSEVTTIGLDLAKHVFQVHGVDGSGARFCASSRAAPAPHRDLKSVQHFEPPQRGNYRAGVRNLVENADARRRSLILEVP